MPFDGVITDFVAPDLTKPSLEGLAYLLEHPDLWPRGPRGGRWRWYFSAVSNQCGTAGCAIGLAGRQWPEILPRAPSFWGSADWYVVSDILRLDMNVTEIIFASGSTSRGITPLVVAGRIRDYLAGRPIRFKVAGDRSY